MERSANAIQRAGHELLSFYLTPKDMLADHEDPLHLPGSRLVRLNGTDDIPF